MPDLDLTQLNDWKTRLLSDSEQIRLNAISEMMSWAFSEMSDADLEKYIKNDWAVLKDFVLNAKLNSRFVGWLSKGEIVAVIRKNWPVVENLLLRPSTLREAIQKKGKGKPLFTPLGAEWFRRECRHFYIFFRVLSYNCYCPKCTLLLDPLKPIFAKWSRQGQLLNIYHIECVVPRKELVSILDKNAYAHAKITKIPSPMVNTTRPQ